MQKGFVVVNTPKSGQKTLFAKLDVRKKKLVLCKSESSLIAAQSIDINADTSIESSGDVS